MSFVTIPANFLLEEVNFRVFTTNLYSRASILV